MSSPLIQQRRLLASRPKSASASDTVGASTREFLASREANFLPAHRLHTQEQTSLLNKYLPNACTRILHDFEDHVFCGIFGDDGKLFITASQDPCVNIYDVGADYRLISTMEVHDIGWSVLDIDYSCAAGALVYCGWSPKAYYSKIALNSDDSIRSVQSSVGLDFRPTVRGFSLFSVAFSPCGHEILAGSNDACVYVYDLERNERVSRINAHDEDVNSVVYADDTSQVFYTASDDCTVKVTNVSCLFRIQLTYQWL
jgi:WD repeat-containing protein 23